MTAARRAEIVMSVAAGAPPGGVWADASYAGVTSTVRKALSRAHPAGGTPVAGPKR